MKTAIVGSGFVGRAWAITFARAGHEVRLWDADAAALPAALAFIRGVLPDLARNDLLNGGAPDERGPARRSVASLTARTAREADGMRTKNRPGRASRRCCCR